MFEKYIGYIGQFLPHGWTNGWTDAKIMIFLWVKVVVSRSLD